MSIVSPKPFLQRLPSGYEYSYPEGNQNVPLEGLSGEVSQNKYTELNSAAENRTNTIKMVDKYFMLTDVTIKHELVDGKIKLFISDGPDGHWSNDINKASMFNDEHLPRLIEFLDDFISSFDYVEDPSCKNNWIQKYEEGQCATKFPMNPNDTLILALAVNTYKKHPTRNISEFITSFFI